MSKHWSDEVGAWGREIVAKRVTITTAIGGVVSALAVLGVIPTGVDEQITGWFGTGFTVLAAVVGALWARQGVTPADTALKPVSADGQPLLTVADAEAAAGVGRAASPVAATDALAAAQAIHPMTPPAQ